MSRQRVIIVIFAIAFFVCYGPFSFFRTFYITTLMTTKSHQWLAGLLYDDKTITKVMKENRVVEVKEVTDLSKIKITYRNKPYSLEKIHGVGFSGYLVKIYDPTRVKLVTSQFFLKEGENALEVSRRSGAKVLINAGGFYDPEWASNGAIPHGTVLKDGKIISDYGRANVGGGFVGFSKEGKLFLGDVPVSYLKTQGIDDAIQFGPFLMINGKSSVIVGNGGWGRAPRTVIGQCRDGVVLFLVINGRIPSSIGATMKDLIYIMKKNHAYNAVNMDGGSSSTLIINNKIINKPVGGGENGMRSLPLFWSFQ